MSELQSSSPKPATGILVVVSIIAIVFAGLWLRERERKPTEVVREVEKPVQVIKEVLVEKIREVPKEVVKEVEVIKKVEVIKEVEVPAKLTDEQEAAIDFSARFFAAPRVKSRDEVFYKIEAVAVRVHMNDAVKKVVSEDRVKNKFELILRQHSIRLDEKAFIQLSVTLRGLWNKDENLLTYYGAMNLEEVVTIGRKGDLRGVIATTWHEGSYGHVGKNFAEKATMDSVEEMAESFANKFLASRDKEPKKDTSK